jgi:Ti-type conjugative transfer relaxase TraA
VAIYSFRGQYVGVSHSLKSCIGAAAYRAGVELVDPITGDVYDPRHDQKKHEVVHSEILASEGSPEWVRDRQQLWGNAELARNRAVGVTAREIRIALPRELTQEQQVELMRGFFREEFVARGMVVDWNLHLDDHGKNPHVHVMLTTRRAEEHGFAAKKERTWDDRKLYRRWREEWAHHANRALELAGHEERIDHRSYKERGLDLEPQPKAYRSVGDEPERAREQLRVAQENAANVVEDPTIVLRKITHQRATFRREDIEREVKSLVMGREGTPGGEERVAACMEAVMRSRELVAMPNGRYTTEEMLTVERRLYEAADALHAREERHPVHEGRVDEAIVHANERLAQQAAARGDAVAPTVTPEQREALEHLLTSSGDVAIVQGRAGSGKSFLLGAAREVWEASGYRVVGGALAGKASDELHASSGIESRTLAAWERAWSLDRDHLGKRDVIVIDEAAMLGSRQLGRIMDYARIAEAKVVLVGDDNQLQAIEAGSPFRALTERLGAATLSEVRRQRVGWQKEASEAFGRKSPREALRMFAQRGLIIDSQTSEEARLKVVRAWAEGLKETPIEKQLMLAFRRDEVTALNTAARAIRKEQGALGKDVAVTTEYGTRDFAKGDRVYFGKNDRALGVKNGTLGTIESVNAGRMVVRLDSESKQPRRVAVDLAEYKHLDHAYAVTIHKSQGATLDRTYVLASKLFDSAKSYVAMSRQREHCEVHWARDELGTRKELLRVMTREVAKEMAVEAIQERPATLEEALDVPGAWESYAPVEQRRILREAQDALRELGESVPVSTHLEAMIGKQPEVQKAAQAHEKAWERVASAHHALSNYRGSSWLEKRPGGESDLEGALVAARELEKRAAEEVNRMREACRTQVQKELEEHNKAVGRISQKIGGWENGLAEVAREAAREVCLDRIAATELGRSVQRVRWAGEKDVGAAKYVGRTSYAVRGVAQDVGVFERAGGLVVSDISPHQASRLELGAEVQLGLGGRGGAEVQQLERAAKRDRGLGRSR